MNYSILLSFKRWFTVLSLAIGFVFTANAERVEIDGLYYEINISARTASVTYQNRTTSNYSSLTTDVVIPQTVTYNNVSFTVTTISNQAFANCTALESISIPGSVTQIGETNYMNSSLSYDAYLLPFYNCTSLKSVRFEDGVSTLYLGAYYNTYSNNGKGLFYSCPLEEVYIGRNISYEDYDYGSSKFINYPDRYGYSAFYNQPKLAKVTIGAGCTELTDYLFYKNVAITLMTLPNIKKIGNSTFKECSKLTTLNLGNSLETVGNYAFYNDESITKLTFPDATTSIGNMAFHNCNSITEVTFGGGLKSIGISAFFACKSFTALILPDTFTTIGESAFEGCTKLTVAKLGTSLTAIPDKVFKNCSSLSEMVVPATAKSIGNQAFYNDSGIATITMNEGLETIGNEVFWNNSGVMQFSIPGTVTKIGTNSFYGCTNTTYLTFRDGEEILTINNEETKSAKIDAKATNSNHQNRYYDYFYDCPIRFLTLGRNLKYSYSISQSMYDLNGDKFVIVNRASSPFINKTDLRSVKIGNMVTLLYNDIFDGCNNISKIEFPDGLYTIGDYAFNGCDKLTNLNFPNQLNSLGISAFANCTALESIIFANQLTSLGDRAFYCCTALENIVFDNNGKGTKALKIGNNTFEECALIQTLTFPGRLSYIGNYTFSGCLALNSVTFEDSPSDVTLGYGALNTSNKNSSSIPLFGNSQLHSLYIGRNIDYKASSSYGYSPFYNQIFLTDVRFSQAGTVTNCKDFLLYKVNNCKELILPQSLKTIGTYTFRDMSVLQSIDIPNAVTEIGAYAFSGDKGMKSARLSASCPWLKEGLFYSCDSLVAITIPPVVTKMDANMFANCKALATITFSGNADMIEMGYGASNSNYGLFRDCPIETLNLDRWLSYNTDDISRAPFYSIATLKNLNIGDNVKVIDKYMFSYCTGLEEVYIPDNIESVGLWGFRGCTSLKSVRFSEKLSQVSDYGFSECILLDNVVFPESMTSIADNSFSNCTSLKSLDLGKKLMVIGPAAFKNCSALEGINIPESLYGLGIEAFSGCSSLPNVALRGISSVGRQAFQSCTGLQWVSLSDKTTSVGEDSFAGCTEIKYVKSYAEFPPEGLVNFPALVPQNGTLFVPEASVEYYQYSPTWENWLDIRSINENVMVTSITLDKSEISFKVAETEQLTATVGTDEVTDKNVLWCVANSDIASVDANGLVTANAVGETDVTAIAADGSGIKTVCHITVIPTLVESIVVSGDSPTLKKGRKMELTTIVTPYTATNTSLVWTSSNDAIASVSTEGVVTTHISGEVVVTATSTDGSKVFGSYPLTVIPPMKGDSNGNDKVTITDAVNTANYAVGKVVENFCFEAADVNGDNRITLADASGTVTELLNMQIHPAAMKVGTMSRAREDMNFDNLVIADYSCEQCKTAEVTVTIENSIDYVAMQADIIVPKGMKLMNVESGERAAANHSLMLRRIDDNTMRVALFDINNSAFADNYEAILRITIKAETINCGDIVMNNILAADANAHEYMLTSTGGHNSNLSGIDNIIGDGNIRIIADKNGINIYNAEGKDVCIYAVDGTLMTSFTAESNKVSRNIINGVYIVTIENVVAKVLVK